LGRKIHKILIIGASGLLGQSLFNKLNSNIFDTWGTFNSKLINSKKHFHLDILKENFLEYLPNNDFDYVIMCSALTDQKFCQENPQISKLINYKRTLDVIKFYLSRGAFIVFPSTSLVFDGNKKFPETEDKKNPISDYAKNKSMVEDYLLKLYPDRISIVRLTKIIGKDFPLFSNWINQIINKEKVFPFKDMFFSPISALLAVECIENIILMNKAGITHVSASGDISYFNALTFIADKLRLDHKLINPKSYLDVDRRLFVPRFSSLGTKSLSRINISTPKPNSSLVQYIKNKSNELL